MQRAGAPCRGLYLHRLIRKGFKVAICEQLEDEPRRASGPARPLMRRGVVRIVAGHAHRGGAAPADAQQLSGRARERRRRDGARLEFDISTGSFATELLAPAAWHWRGRRSWA
ncbi:MAG: hypothetical protein U1E17_01545 [Geminicoccaceae bacterium]